jgi:hypothetical protein
VHPPPDVPLAAFLFTHNPDHKLASKRQEKKRSFLKCMSFVPAPQQAIAAANNAPTPVTSSAVATAADTEVDKDLLFKLRTFDVYWVDKTALMYKDGIDKVSFQCQLLRWKCLRFRSWR